MSSPCLQRQKSLMTRQVISDFTANNIVMTVEHPEQSLKINNN